MVVVELLVDVPDAGFASRCAGSARRSAGGTGRASRSRSRCPCSDASAALCLPTMWIGSCAASASSASSTSPVSRLTGSRKPSGALRIGIVGGRHATFIIACTSAVVSFSFVHTASRKRLTRPSSRPSAPLRAWSRPARRCARGARRPPVAVELVQRARPVGEIAEVEVRVARMIGDRAPVLRVLHAVDDRAVAAGRLAEAAAMVARGERAELAIDERDDLARQVVGVAADRRRVDVLVAAESR